MDVAIHIVLTGTISIVSGWNLNNYFTLKFIECLHKKKNVCGFGVLNRVPFVC